MFADDESRVALGGTLLDAYRRSLGVGRELTSRLAASPPEHVSTVVAVGSLGRLELVPSSDLDLVVVLDDDAPREADVETRAHEAVWNVAESLGYARPKAVGVFGRPTRPSTLCDPARRGRVDEEPNVFGKRLHLLLEGRPVLGADVYSRLLDDVLGWYGFGESYPRPFREWTTLAHDVERYRHSLAVRYQWLHRDDPATWRRLHSKSRFSRALNVAGLTTLVGECSTRVEAGPWLRQQLDRTPLERIAFLGEAVVERVVPCYERFLATLDSGDERDAYESLLDDAETFRTAIADGLRRRSVEWSDDLQLTRWT